EAGMLLNRLSSSYRSMQSYRDNAIIRWKIEDKEQKADVALAAQRPNKYLMDVKGDYLNTLVVSDGSTLVAFRADRKAYTKVKAPLRLIGSDMLAGIDSPSLGSQIITTLLQGRTGDPDLLAAMAKS